MKILMNVVCIPTEVRFVPGNALIYQDPIDVLVQMDGGHWPTEDRVKMWTSVQKVQPDVELRELCVLTLEGAINVHKYNVLLDL